MRCSRVQAEPRFLERPSHPPGPAPQEGVGGDGVELSPQAHRLLEGSHRSQRAPGLREGDQGREVLSLQQALVRWMPGWRGLLSEDGVYGPQTRRAVQFFKKVHGTGRDGRSLDGRTSELLEEVRSGAYWVRHPGGRRHRSRVAEMEGRYQRALRSGYPFREPDSGLSPEQVREVAARAPERTVRYRGFQARALTFKRLLGLEGDVERQFPGYRLAITCTTGGTHAGSAHGQGRALDLVLERTRDGYRPEAWEFDSAALEELARSNGFETLNEYLLDSTYRTGQHLHVEAWPVS